MLAGPPAPIGRRRFLAAGAALLAAGCAAQRQPLGTYEVTEVPAPVWRRGDRWTYRRTDVYTKLDAGTVTREIVDAGPNGLRVVTQTTAGRLLDEATYSAPGVQLSGNLSEDSPSVAGKFTPPFERYAFPLTSGKRWRQNLTRTDANEFRNQCSAGTRVEGWETLQVDNRDTRTITIRRDFYLGPKDPFTGDLMRYETEWYAPDAKAPARLYVEEWYYDRHNDFFSPLMPGGRTLYELTSFAAG